MCFFKFWQHGFYIRLFKGHSAAQYYVGDFARDTFTAGGIGY
jgi:hypothetical protein